MNEITCMFKSLGQYDGPFWTQPCPPLSWLLTPFSSQLLTCYLELELMSAGHKQVKYKSLTAGKAVFPTAWTLGGYTGSLKSIANREVPRSRGMAQLWELRDKGVQIRAGKSMIKRVIKIKQVKRKTAERGREPQAIQWKVL